MLDTKFVSVQREVITSIASRYEHGKCSRVLYRRRQELADEALTALGETVPDTAIGNELIQAWLTNRLRDE